MPYTVVSNSIRRNVGHGRFDYEPLELVFPASLYGDIKKIMTDLKQIDKLPLKTKSGTPFTLLGAFVNQIDSDGQYASVSIVFSEVEEVDTLKIISAEREMSREIKGYITGGYDLFALN